MTRCSIIGLTAVFLIMQLGCVTVAVPPVPSQELRNSIGTVAIVPANVAPQSNFQINWRYREGGAGKQAALTAGAGAAATATAAVVAAPIALPVIILSGIIATGAMSAADAARTSNGIVALQTATDIESAIKKAVADMDMQNTLARHLETIIRSDPGIRLNRDSADTTIEVAINNIGFDGCIMHDWECRPPHIVNLFMHAHVRLVRVADGAVLFTKSFKYTSANHELTMWTTDNGRLLGEELDLGYRELAERIHDEVFLITAIALPFRGGMYEPQCWLQPLYPKSYAQVTTLQPTLHWTAFPRDIDRQELDPELLHKITDVTYDLRIWDQEAELQNKSFTEQWRNRVIYERAGLIEPQHLIETPLAASKTYYWSVRARFKMDGQPMALRWSRSSNECQSEDKMLFLYHTFSTPEPSAP